MKVLIYLLCTTILFLNLQTAQAENLRVSMQTSKGTAIIELYADKAPITVKNFLAYVDAGDYNGTIFHRVIKDFMNQAGAYTSDHKYRKPTRPAIHNEADNGLKNLKYTIAMARTAEPHSASSQFFINTGDNKALDHTAKTPEGWGYAVFGKVVEGEEVMQRIAKVKTGAFGPFRADAPYMEIVIHKMNRVNKPLIPKQ